MFGAHPMLRTGGAVSYSVPYSLRFRAANSAYLSRTSGASPTDKKKATLSSWIKAAPSISSSTQVCILTSTGNACAIGWNIASYSGDFFVRVDGPGNDIRFPIKFRDPSAWGHLQIAVDTTDATASDRVKVYWNGVRLTPNASTYPTLNSDTTMNPASTAFRFMSDVTNGTYIDGYAGEVNFIDGQALTPSSFGQTDSATGVWVPKAYAGTYGTNGFYLKFADASAATATAIGKDSSGNSNNWTPSGISVTSGTTFDQMLDTPTLNYAVMNPLSKSSTPTPAQANLFISMGAVYPANVLGSIGVRSGKFYFETSLSGTGGSANGYAVGVATGNWANLNADPGGDSTSYTHLIDSRAYFSNNAATTNNSTSFTAGDIIGIAIDADNLTITFYKNNVQVGSAQTLESGQTWFPMFKNSTIAATLEYTANFGQRAFSYTPPTGFKALNTANLPTPSIKKGSLYMDATLRTGTGATASVSSLGFQPDLVWIKGRSGATDHGLYDAVRGVQKQLESNTTTDETTEATGLTAFSSNGYTVGALAQLNTNAATYVDWAWKKGVTSGFDIVTYTGNGVARTISHALGFVPKLMIVKARSTASTDQGWAVYHSSNTAAPETDYLLLDSTAATADLDTVWNDTAPTSSVFSVGTNALVNTNTDTYVAYLWSEVEGFSKFGSYTGNASTDGPFVWCGFRPRFVMLKDVTNVAYWVMIDTVRNTVNVVSDELLANTANAENGLAITTAIDCTANGFKIRTSDANLNQSGDSYIFAAFAENPFKYARAR